MAIGPSAEDRLIDMVGRTRREAGKLVTYLRLAGVEPPPVEYDHGRRWQTRGRRPQGWDPEG